MCSTRRPLRTTTRDSETRCTTTTSALATLATATMPTQPNLSRAAPLVSTTPVTPSSPPPPPPPHPSSVVPVDPEKHAKLSVATILNLPVSRVHCYLAIDVAGKINLVDKSSTGTFLVDLSEPKGERRLTKK